MTRKFLFALVIVFTSIEIVAQELGRLSFEVIDRQSRLPLGPNGKVVGDNISGYAVGIDSLVKFDGKYSLRISSDPAKSGQTYGAINLEIPARYAGSRITVKAFMKTEDIGAEGAGLWMRIDGASGPMAFGNMRKEAVKGTTDWKEYALELPLDEEAEKIVFGGLMTGSAGKIWLDAFRIEVDGQPIEKAQPKIAKVYKAKQDTAFVRGSGIDLVNPDKNTLRNLRLLGQVWGFLKYYHPSIANGDYNWDFELFRFLPAYLQVKSQTERDKLFLGWLDKLGPPTPCASCEADADRDVHMKPDLAWMQSSKLDPVLSDRLNGIVKNRNQKKHYYISTFPGVGNPDFRNEDPYKQFSFPDDGFRLLALYRYWNMIQYFFPYKYAIGEDWNKVLEEFTPKFIQAKDNLEYRLVALELIGRIHDTHANVWGRDSALARYKGKFRAPVQTKFTEGKLVVTNYYQESMGQRSGLLVGDVITTINGVPVTKIVKDKLKYYPASNYATQLRDIAKDVLRSNQRSLDLDIQRNKSKLSQKIRTFPLDSVNTAMDWAYNKPDSCYKFVSDDIGYIYLGNIKASLLPRIFERFKSTKGIVIDLRNYPSEFMVFALTPYLTGSEKEFVRFTRPVTTYPGEFKMEAPIKVGGGNEKPYQGKIVILINEITQSQAEYTTMAFRASPNATVLGSTTAAADGNVSSIVLPGNISSMISGIGVFYPDGTATQRVGIVPDEELKPTIQGVAEKRDELLERAVQIIKGEKPVGMPIGRPVR